MTENTKNIHPKAEWITDESHEARRKRWQLKRKLEASGLESDHQIYRSQRQAVTHLIHSAETDFYRSDIQTAGGDQKLFFITIGRLLHKTKDVSLPSVNSSAELAEQFKEFFNDKVSRNHRSLLDGDVGEIQVLSEESVVLQSNCCLYEFSQATTEEIRQLLRKSPVKSCELDPMPTYLLRKCEDVVVPIMTKIINISLKSGTVLADLRIAHLCPLLRKPIWMSNVSRTTDKSQTYIFFPSKLNVW